MTLSLRFSLLILATAWTAAATPLAVRQGRPVVDGVYVNGNGPFRFLLDTGAESSQLDVRVAKEIGLVAEYRVELAALGGMRRVPGVGGVRVRLGEAEAASELLLTGLDGVRAWAPDVQGVLGQSFLGRFDYRLDFRAGRVEFGAHERPGIRAELERRTGVPVVFTSLGRMIVDTGTERLIVFGTARGGAMILRTAAGIAAAEKVGTKELVIEGVALRTPGAYSVSRPAGMGVDGLVPATMFAAVFLCNSRGYIVFE